MPMTTKEYWKLANGTFCPANDPNRVTLVAPWGAELAGSSFPVADQPSAPTLTAIYPTGSPVGKPDLTLVLTGTHFTTDCHVYFNGVVQDSRFISATELWTTVKPSLGVVGAVPVQVKDNWGNSTASVNFTFS